MNKKSVFKRVVSTVLSLSMVLSYIDIGPIKELTSLVMNAVAEEPAPGAKVQERAKLQANSRRVFLWWAGGNIGGVDKKNYIHVYAKAGETITFGSNVYNSLYNENGSTVQASETGYDISMVDLNGRRKTFDVVKDGIGYIGDFGTEEAAKLDNTLEDGKLTYGTSTFTPLTYVAPETGVYTFEFHSYSGGGDGDTADRVNKSDKFPDTTVTSGLVAAWDVSVFNEDGDREVGRTYADYLAVQTDGTVVENYWIVTTDSYIYKMDFLGCAPYTYSFFSNNRGLVDNSNGNVVYKSVKNTRNDLSGAGFNSMGVTFKYPGTKPDDLDRSFYIFFDEPDVEDLTGALFDKPKLPDKAENLQFVTKVTTEDGKEIPGSYEGKGGYFSFYIKQATTASIKLTFNGSKFGGEYAPVELSGPVKPYSTNYFYWDGKDGNGKEIPAGEYEFDDITYEITAKSGEIHFPIVDMENASQGITITRVSDLYSSDGTKINDLIYEKTKSVIYYDDTAIYYGEKVASGGTSENQTYEYLYRGKNTSKNWFATDTTTEGGQYFKYNNALDKTTANATQNGGEYDAYTAYAKDQGIRLGDHSHTTNVINYTKPAEYTGTDEDFVSSQQAVINYLDSSIHPLGKTSNGSCICSDSAAVTKLPASTAPPESVTDHAIANYWTFIPSVNAFPPEEIKSNKITILGEEEDDTFNYIGRVFYDDNRDGSYDESKEAPFEGVTVELYKATDDTEFKTDKTYFNSSLNVQSTGTNPKNDGLYELVKSDVTNINGTYIFTNIKYDKENGTEFIYHVKNPDEDTYDLTSMGDKAPSTRPNYGHYYLYYPIQNVYGNEIQRFTVGGTGVDLDTAVNGQGYVKDTITAIDVGYNYVSTGYDIKLQKEWKTDGAGDPDVVYYDLSYSTAKNSNGQHYKTYSISAAVGWLNAQNINNPPAEIDGEAVTDYYVAAEYYFKGGYLFKHVFEYENGKYGELSGKTYYYNDKPGVIADIRDLGDINHDEIVDAEDLSAIGDAQWAEYVFGTTKLGSGDGVKPYHAAVDKNFVEGKTDVTIKVVNSSEEKPASIEVYKYYDNLYKEGTEDIIDDSNALRGATFRLYKNTEEEVKAGLAPDATADAKKKLEEVETETTRINGRYIFTGLDPKETYTLRELFSPVGYRITNEYTEITSGMFEKNNNKVTVYVPNTRVEEGFYIRKRLSGRIWEPSDTFSFTMTMNEGESGYQQGTGNTDVNDIFENSTDNLNNAVNTFRTDFNSTYKTVTINNDTPFYTYDDETGNHISADTKAASLLVSDTASKGSDVAATLNGLPFPAAGEYTFTIKEENCTDKNITGSAAEYQVTFSVTRKYNSDVEEGTTPAITEKNTHLAAEVSRILVKYSPGGAFEDYASTMPMFTNRYTASAEQSASYVISKNLEGREWLEDDAFTFKISTTDDTTIAALTNGNFIVQSKRGSETLETILGKDKDDPGEAKTEYTGTISAADGKITIDELNYENVSFPVVYVNGDGVEWTGEEDPSAKQIQDGGWKRVTKPVTYVLDIEEIIPAETNGIKYSSEKYQLKITLKNALNDEGEIDGEIDDIELELYYIPETGKASRLIGRCTIINGKQEHNNKAHAILFTNIYEAELYWSPSINKYISGREWDEFDEFAFSIACTSANKADVNVVQGARTVTIKNSSTGGSDYRTGKFGWAEFTKPGKYTFDITETNNIEERGFVKKVITTIYVEIKDDNKGKLTFIEYPDGFDNPDTKKEVDIEESSEGQRYLSTSYNITNQYKDDPDTTYSFDISKKLDGRNWASSDIFTFELTPNDEATKNAVDSEYIKLPADWTKSGDKYTVTVNSADPKNVSIAFPKFDDSSNNDPKNYTFTLSEQSGSGNMDYSKEKYTLTFTVKRNRHQESVDDGTKETYLTGKIDVDLSVTKSGAEEVYNSTDTSGTFSATFTNSAYATDEFKVSKSFFGTWPTSKSFEAVIKRTDTNGGKVTIDGTEIAASKSTTIEFTEDDKVKTPEIKFYEEGTYTFEVKETAPAPLAKEPIDYDSSTYTVTAKVTDNGSGSLNVEYEIDGKTGNEVKIENAAVGSLSVTKAVECNKPGVDVPTDKEFKDKEFTINVALTLPEGLPERYLNSSAYSVTSIDGIEGSSIGDVNKSSRTFTVTLTLKAGQTATINHLPTGTAYSITEEGPVFSFTPKDQTITGDVVVNETTSEYKETVTNIYNVNDITISKKVQKEDKSDISGEDDTEFSFNITLKNGEAPLDDYIYTSNEDVTWNEPHDGTGTFTITPKKSITLKNIPYGATYSIEETGDYAGYVKETVPVSGTVGGSALDVKFVNTKLATHDLTIEKTVDSTMAADLEQNFKFDVTLTAPDGTIFDDVDEYTAVSGLTRSADGKTISGIITLGNKGTATIAGLPNGTVYTVEEQDTYDEKLVSSVSSDYDEAEGKLDDNKTVKFVNTRQKGSLTISKTVESADSGFDKDSYSFEFKVKVEGIDTDREYPIENYSTNKVTFDKEKETTLYLKDKDIVTIGELPDGAAYTVTEEGNANYFTLVNGELIDSESPKAAAGNIVPGTPSEVDFVNIYDKQPTKELDPDISSVQVGDEINYSIKWYNNSKDTANVTITDTLPAQLDYDKAEVIGAGSSGYDIQVKGNEITLTLKGCAGLSSGTVKVFAKVNEKAAKSGFTNTAAVEVGKNEYTVSSKTIGAAEIGNIKISKKAAGSLADKNQYFTFKITEAVDNSGTPLTGTYNYTGGKEGTGTFDFSTTDSLTFELKDGDSIIINALPAGAKITVEEKKEEGTAAADYVTSVKEIPDKVTAVSDNIAKLTVVKSTDTEAAFTNRKDGLNTKSIDKTKLTGDHVSVGDTIPYVITWNNNSEYKADVTITDTLADGLEIVSHEEPEGETDKEVTYEYIPETNTAKWTLKGREAGEKGEVRLTVKVNEAAVKWDGKNTASITVNSNEDKVSTEDEDIVYVKKGNISLTKSVTGTEKASELGRYFAFTIDANTAYNAATGSVPLSGSYDFTGTMGKKLGSDDTITEVTDGKIEFKSGKAEIFLKAGQSIEIIGLPANGDDKHKDFTITEAEVPGYTVSITPEPDVTADSRTYSGKVPVGNTANIVYENHKLEEHDLTILKVVAGKNGNKLRSWNFKVELTAPEGTVFAKTYTDTYKVTKGNFEWTGLSDDETKLTGSFSLVSGESLIINGLPEGTVYDVIENGLPKDYEVSAEISGKKATLAESDGLAVNTAKLSDSKTLDLTLDDDKSVIITNESPIPEAGEGRYSLTKKVTGVGLKPDDMDTEWHFDLQFGNMDAKDYDYTKLDISASDPKIIEEGIISLGSDGKITSIKVKDSSGTFTVQPDNKITLKNSQIITIYRLKAGETVTVSEVGDLNGYETTFTQYTAPTRAASAEEAAKDYTVTVPNKSDVVVTCTNKRLPGNLNITSEVENEGGDTIDDKTEFEFDITLTTEKPLDSDVCAQFKDIKCEEVDGKYVYTCTVTGREFNFSGLPDGTEYTVEEHLAPGYKFKNGINRYEGTITAGETSSAPFVNIKISEATLIVTKLLDSSITTDSDKAFTIRIYLTAPKDTILADKYSYTVSPSDEYSDVRTLTKVSGDKWEGNFNLIPGQTATISGLPQGTFFEISEPSADGFDPDISRNKAVLDKKENEVTITNRRKTADLTISKKISSDSELTATDRAIPFEFEIGLGAGTTGLDIKDIDGTYGYDGTYSGTVTFSDGKVTGSTGEHSPFGKDGKLTLKHDESIEIKGLPVGTYYTVNEVSAYSGYTPETGPFNGYIYELPKNNPAESSENNLAAFVNNKNVGTLEISKKVVHSDGGELSGGSTEDNFVFDVYMSITLPDDTKLPLSGTFGDYTFENGHAAITLKNGGTAVISGVPFGTDYLIEEDLSGKGGIYTSTVTSGNDSGQINNDTTPVKVEYVNKKSVASLKVTKTVENADTNISTIDSNKDFSFTLTLTNSNVSVAGTYKTDKGEIIIDNGGVGTFTLKDGESLTIYGIPTGTSYTVQEAADADYNVKINGISDEDGSSEGMISSDSTVAFTNVKKSAVLTVTKEITSENEITDDDKRIPFKFTIELEVPVNDGTEYRGLDGTVRAEIKRVNGGLSESEDLVFDGGSCSTEITLHHGDSVKLIDIPIGTKYTVTETTKDPGYTYTPDEADGKISGTVEKEENLKFINKKVSGSLTISKTVNNSDGSPLSSSTAEEKFDFGVKLTDDGITFNTATVSINGETATPIKAGTDGKFHIPLGNEDRAVFTDIPVGTHYEITEDLSGKDGYASPEVKDNNANSSINGGNVSGDIDGTSSPVQVEYINTKNVGSLTITNTVQVSDGSALNDTDKEPFEFSVLLGSKARAAAGYENEYQAYIGEKGSSAASDVNASVSFNADGTLKSVTYYNGTEESFVKLSHNMEITIYGIPLDMGYQVTETQRPGYTMSAVGDNGTISADSIANYINIRYVGSLTVTKTIVNSDGSEVTEDQKNEKFDFEVRFYTTDASGIETEYDKQTFELGHDGTITFDSIPAGMSYTVSETDSKGYSSSGDVSGIIKKDTEDTVAFINTFEVPELGSLTVTKTVVNSDGSEVTDDQKNEKFDFEVRFYTTDASGIETEYDKQTFELGHDGTITFDSIPAGMSYTVSETDSKGYSSSGDVSGIIKKDTEDTAAFTNTFEVPEPGSLTVTKTILNSDGSEVTDDQKNEKFGFEVRFYTTDASGAETEYDKQTFELSHGGTITFDSIPAGMSYTVTEIDSKGYASSGDVSGRIDNGAAVMAEFINTNEVTSLPDTGSLTLTKHVNVLSGTPDPEDTFTFSITLVYPDTTSETREAVLHGGESTIIEDIPTGTAYTISEISMPGGYAAQDMITGNVNGDITEIFVNNFGSSTDPDDPPDIPTPPPGPPEHIDPPEPPKTDELIIHKDVVDAGGNDINSENKDSFEFVVEIFRMDGDYALGSFEYTGTMGSSGSVSSGGKITLKAGETVTIEGIPVGYGYRVREVLPESGEYKVNGSINVSGTIVDHRANEVDFENLYTPKEKPEDPDKSAAEDPDDTDNIDPDDAVGPDDDDAANDTAETETSYESADSGASASSEEDELPDDEHKDIPEYPDDAEEAKEPEELEVPDKTDADGDIPYEPEAQENPKTGNTSPASAIFAMLASAAAMMFTRKKKK